MAIPKNQNFKEEFLRKSGINDFKIKALPADASSRTYDRICIKNGPNQILMCCPPEKENLKQFIKVSQWLTKHEFSAPEIFHYDADIGLALVEDFGDEKFSTILNNQSPLSSDLDADIIYNKAVDVLIKLAATPLNIADFACRKEEKYIQELSLFTEWYMATVTGAKLSSERIESFQSIWHQLLPLTRVTPDTTVLFDYHVDNLIWLDDRIGVKKVGILDHQDAFTGCCAYDLVSLLEDARIDVSKEITVKMLTKYLEARPDINRKNFMASYAILGAQRNMRIIGNFTKRAIHNDNSNYLKYLPRIWKYLEGNLTHPLLHPLKNWLDKIVSPEIRQYNNDQPRIKVF